MPSERITIRVSQALGQRIRKRSQMKGLTESELVREALENDLEHSAEGGSAYEMALEAGLIGCLRHAPKDLSTNARHFEGFGKSK